jgi:transposase
MRRSRRAKTDKIAGEPLVRTLLAYKRGEPRVCAMVRVPKPEEEARRRLCRERRTLTAEGVSHVNRVINRRAPENQRKTGVTLPS